MSDVTVVGGGLAGSSLAILLGRRGLDVELYEQACFPRDKPCGEGLLPGGVEVLRAMGLEGETGGQPFAGVRYHIADASVRAGFGTETNPWDRYGLGQRRLRLDAVLWQAARRTAGVRAHQGVRIDAPLVEHGRVVGVVVDGEQRRARLVVAADGSASTLRRCLGLERTALPRRVGIRAHFRRPRDQERLTDVQIFMRRGYELYVTPLPDDEILVAALAHQDAAGQNLRRSFERWLTGEPLLGRWLDGATQTSELMGRAPLVRHADSRSCPGLVLLGDAASSVDPVTAGGMSLALISAELLAWQVPAMLRGSRLAARRFERSRARAVRVHRWLGACLLALGQRPSMATRARQLMQAYPDCMQALVHLAARRPEAPP